MNCKSPPKEWHVKVDNNDQKAPNLLSQHCGLSIAEIKSCMQKGAIWLSDKTGTHRIRRAGKKLSAGDELHFYCNPEILQANIDEPVLLHEAGQYSIWVKPAGVLSQGSKWGDHCAIARWVEVNDIKQRPAFIVHRLDRAACGLMLIAHGKKIAAEFSAMFATRRISKHYVAYVNGDHSTRSVPQTIDETLDEKVSITHIEHISYDTNTGISTFHINIETGRKHQIRKHLANIGCHILNDRLYQPEDLVSRSDINDHLQLYAVSLQFECPVDNEVKHYQLPEEFLPNHSAHSTASRIIEPPTTV